MKFEIQKITRENSNFRQVVWTGDHTQLVLMSLKPGEEIGLETHDGIDQMLFFTQGQGTATVAGEELEFAAGDVVVVPAGAEHNFTNDGDKDVKLFTTYSPPEHPDGTVHATKAQAEAAHH